MTERIADHLDLLAYRTDMVMSEDLSKAARVMRLMEEALERIANIKADDGDDFSTMPPETIIRCEVTVADLIAARKALAAAKGTNDAE